MYSRRRKVFWWVPEGGWLGRFGEALTRRKRGRDSGRKSCRLCLRALRQSAAHASLCRDDREVGEEGGAAIQAAVLSPRMSSQSRSNRLVTLASLSVIRS